MSDLMKRLRGSKDDKRTYMNWQHEIMCEAADRIEQLERELMEEARLNGMGSEREAKLMAQLAACQKERDAYKFMYEGLCK